MIKVMIVDDEKYVRMGIKNGTDWSLIGCEVVGEAPNGAEALEIAEEIKPDLVISDIKMPKMDGIELATKLVERYPNIKIIFLTAYDDFEYARSAIRIGVSDYLLKPFQDGDLEGAIQRLLHLHSNAKSTTQEMEEQLIPVKLIIDNVGNKHIQMCLSYMENNYASGSLGLAEIAESIGVSEGHLSRLFKSETGISLNNFLIRYRIRKAMDYLKDPQIKVYEVANKVGYQDNAYFSNAFKKLVGKSPSEYQNNGLE